MLAARGDRLPLRAGHGARGVLPAGGPVPGSRRLRGASPWRPSCCWWARRRCESRRQTGRSRRAALTLAAAVYVGGLISFGVPLREGFTDERPRGHPVLLPSCGTHVAGGHGRLFRRAGPRETTARSGHQPEQDGRGSGVGSPRRSRIGAVFYGFVVLPRLGSVAGRLRACWLWVWWSPPRLRSGTWRSPRSSGSAGSRTRRGSCLATEGCWIAWTRCCGRFRRLALFLLVFL